jgi:hypothetical protein
MTRAELHRLVDELLEESVDAADWARLLLDVEISARVPEQVQQLFEVARNTLPYGHFFYLLYTLGEQQLYRVADAAALHRYRDLGGPKTKRGHDPAFAARIGWSYTSMERFRMSTHTNGPDSESFATSISPRHAALITPATPTPR